VPNGNRVPGPGGSKAFQLELTGPFGSSAGQGRVPGAAGAWKSAFGIPALTLNEDVVKSIAEISLRRVSLTPVWDFALEHGRLLLDPPVELPSPVARPRPLHKLGLGVSGSTDPYPRLVFEIPPIDDALVKASKTFAAFASFLKLDAASMKGGRLWVVYQNDGGPPFNPGSGSDQGPTASLAVFMTFDRKRTGLTRLGWTVIDMRTPRPTLPAGEPFSSTSSYQAPRGPYSGISSIDFAVTVHRTGTLKVDVTGSAGVDSSKWGKFVQDFIHTKVSNSPLFPWPKDSTKLYAQGGMAVLLTPNLVLNKDQVYGIAYAGTIELGGSVTAGTHRTEASAEARYVIRTAKAKTPLGDFSLEVSPIGAIGRAFLRYNDGREEGFAGVEGALTTSVMVQLGRLGIGLSGQILVSTDPALNTPNAAGSRPVLSPLKEIPGQEPLGGPAGHHGSGSLVLRWEF
jgi:hypothetical protein